MSLFLLVFVVFQVIIALLHGESHFLLQTTLVTNAIKDRVQDDPTLVSSKQLRCLIDCIT